MLLAEVSTSMTTRQLNIRLSPDDRDLLEAIAFVSRTPSATLARDILVSYLSAHQADPGVTEALTALAIADSAQPAAVVRRLHDA
jgi:hypothetical protein